MSISHNQRAIDPVENVSPKDCQNSWHNDTTDCDDEFISQAYDMFLVDENHGCKSDKNVGLSTHIMMCDDKLREREPECSASNACYSKEDRSIESDLMSLFEGDFSDDDPSYHPPRDKALPRSRSESEDSALITLNDLLSPDVCSADEQKFIRKRNKDIALLLNKGHNESLEVVNKILLQVFDRCWKIIKPRSRWRQRNPDSWRANVIKKRRAEGLPYVTKKKCMAPKVPKPTDCSKCKFGCNGQITDVQRERLCRTYWNCDYAAKKNFLIAHCRVNPVRTVLLDRKRQTRRSFSKQCFFKIEGKEINVCQKFFCKTLCICSGVVSDAIKQKNDLGCYSKDLDPRGRKEPPNKISAERVDEVKAHISSFPAMESHYLRKTLKRQYLEKGLSLTKMYKLYEDDCKSKGSPPVSETAYRRIFATEFNLGFFVPKKDQCLLCTKYERANEVEKLKLNDKYKEHIERKKACNREKDKDKQKSKKEPDFLSVSFDLQAILQIPSTDVGLLYYVRKLTVYNLTIYENSPPNEAFCFPWSEIHGKKGSAEIGTILHHYLTECVPDTIKKISLFSDTCGGQNRNQYVAAILLWIVNNSKHLEMIEHKFLESGHTYMEADSMHSAIETAKKNCDVFAMSDWINIFKRARSKTVYKTGSKKTVKNCYHVKEFKYSEFKNLKKLAKFMIVNRKTNTDGEKVQWLKIKKMRYKKGERKIYYNYDMSNNFMTLDVTMGTATQSTIATTSKQPMQSHSYSTRNKVRQEQVAVEPSITPSTAEYIFPPLEQLYDRAMPISEAKKKRSSKSLRQGSDTGRVSWLVQITRY